MAGKQCFMVYSLLILAFTAFANAWPWPKFSPEFDALIMGRQASSDSSSAQTTAVAVSTSQATALPTGSGSVSVTVTDTAIATSASGASSGSGAVATTASATGTAAVTTSAQAQRTTYGVSLPAGGISMVSPAATSGSQYYKIGDYVTFQWNMTGVLATPTALNIVATCASNQALYTLAASQKVNGTLGTVTWDSGSYGQAAATPLIQQIYTLIIYDADSSVTSVPQSGYLSTFNQFRFGMYAEQLPADESLDGVIKCATCSGANSGFDRKSLGFMFAMCSITVLSFTWFVAGTGIMW